MTAFALLLNRGTGYRSIRTKHAAVACFWPEYRFAMGAFVKILTRIRRHDLQSCVPAARTGQHGFKDDDAHGFEVTLEGKPASVVA
jgi:hypothetical protein